MTNYQYSGGQLTVFLTGRITSANASTVDNELKEIIAANPPQSLVLDCTGLEYISSSGLRIVLRLSKSAENLKVINTSPVVFDIFDMTGFTQMMEIRKALLHVSVKGCKVIGEGANGKVYRANDDTIVKVYSKAESPEDIQREIELARKAFVKGIPTAIPYMIVKVDDGFYGSVFERLEARSFADILKSEPERLEEIAQLSAGLLKTIHATTLNPGELPDVKQLTLHRIEVIKPYLPESQYARLWELVAAIPDDRHMIHGDYHLKNIMMQDGEAMLIDMDTLCEGNPVFELGHMYNSFLGYSDVKRDNVKEFIGISYETAYQLWNRILSLYLGTEDADVIRSVQNKAMVIGYSRVMHHFVRHGEKDEERRRLEIENCRQKFSALLPIVSELAI